MKSKKGLKIIVTRFSLVNIKLFHLSAHIHVFNNVNFCMRNSNLSLESCTYNLIVEAKVYDNSQYPQH